MKAAEIRLLSEAELRSKLADARQEHMNLRFQVVSGQLTDTSRLKQSRRVIAQYETVLHQRELAGEEGSK
jgi:large subunit ribosomal protein L29